jgi:hypothetical protein
LREIGSGKKKPDITFAAGFAHPGYTAPDAVAHLVWFRARRSLLAWSRLAAATAALRGSFKVSSLGDAKRRV